MRRILAALAIFALTAPSALAAEADKAGAPGTNVEMQLIAPMSQDGKLLGYAYIQGNVVATSEGAALVVRDKFAFIQDAFVRDVNGAPIGKADDPTAVDVDQLNMRLTADAKRIAGDQNIAHMDFIDGTGKISIQFAPLHPDGTTLNLVPPPDKAPPSPSANQSGSPATSNPAPAASP
jgi:hypothetical protein